MGYTAQVREFTMACNDSLPAHPQNMTAEGIAFIRQMVNDEMDELIDAQTVTEQADALVDAIYYICDFAIRNGVSILIAVFFCVLGMQVDLTALWGADNIVELSLFVLVVTAFAIFSKIVGAGLPALLVRFGRVSAWRIGVGMMPRGEVALIVAEIGRASGIISQDIFTVAIIMTVVTTIIGPIFLARAYPPPPERAADEPAPSLH